MAREKKVIFIASGDWHLHNWKNYNEGDRRIKNGLQIPILIHSLCKKHNVPSLFVGDMFHDDSSLSNKLLHYTLPIFRQIYSDDQPKLIGIDGNHDQCQQNYKEDRSPSYLHTLSQVFPSINCINFSTYVHNGIAIHGIPYITRNKDFAEIVNNIQFLKGRKNILLIHTDLPGAKDTNQRVIGTARNIPDKLSKLFKRFDLVLCGHIHKPQIMDDNVLMLGAPQQQRKTDIGCEMGYWLIYDDMSYKFKPFKDFPKFEVVEEKPNTGENYYIVEKKTGKLKILEKENTKDFNSLMSRKKLVNNYCKVTGNVGKSKKRKLKELLINA